MTARRNSYQPVLVRIYCDYAKMEVWLPFITCKEYLSLERYCQAEVFCSRYIMQIVEPLPSLHAWPTRLLRSSLMNGPLSPEMMIIIDHDNNIYTGRHNNTEIERSTEASCVTQAIQTDMLVYHRQYVE